VFVQVVKGEFIDGFACILDAQLNQVTSSIS